MVWTPLHLPRLRHPCLVEAEGECQGEGLPLGEGVLRNLLSPLDQQDPPERYETSLTPISINVNERGLFPADLLAYLASPLAAVGILFAWCLFISSPPLAMLARSPLAFIHFP